MQKQLLKQNNWSLWSDKYFWFCGCSHILVGKPTAGDLRNSYSPKQSRNKTKWTHLKQLSKACVLVILILGNFTNGTFDQAGSLNLNYIPRKSQPWQSFAKEVCTKQLFGDSALLGANRSSFPSEQVALDCYSSFLQTGFLVWKVRVIILTSKYCHQDFRKNIWKCDIW